MLVAHTFGDEGNSVSRGAMNSSAATLLNETLPKECAHARALVNSFLGGTLHHTTTETYLILVFIEVLNIITCPFTILFNVLVIIALKNKARLRTNSNMVLGCLAVTDGFMGLFAQPCSAGLRISTIQGDTSSKHCILAKLTSNFVRLLSSASLFHLLLMNMDRYLAIRHSLKYATMVTKSRILYSSAIAWTTSILITIPLMITDNMFIDTNNVNVELSIILAIIIFCQVAVYVEIRRHEKQIAAHQISVEARRTFLKAKKALKLTTIVILLLLSSHMPIFVVRILIVNRITTLGKTMVYTIFSTATFAVILNSLINPVIYCVRIRQFRVAFVEILLGKSNVNTRAERLQMRVFGLNNIVAPLEAQERLED